MDRPTLTRRRLLVGGAAALGAGAAGAAATSGQRHLIDRITGVCGPDGERVPRADPPSRIERGVFTTTRAEGGRAGWLISTPPQPPIGLLVYLPGRGARASDADELGLTDLCAPRRLAIAAVEGGATYYHRRADGRDGAALVLDDLLGLALERLGRLPRVIMGASMGGFGAALLAEQQPKAFRGVVVSSGAFFVPGQDRAPGAFDGPDDFARNDAVAGAAALRRLPVRVDCGASDPFLEGNRRFAAATAALAAFPPGCHDRGFWQRVAPAQIAWAAEVLSDASASRP